MATTKKTKKKAKRKKLPSLSLLKRKALRLWSIQVRDIHGNVCALCGQPHRMLNAHHIESKTNYALRFDVLNGVAVCPEHHVFGRDAVHKGIFFYEWLAEHRPAVIEHIRKKRLETVKYDREMLNAILLKLTSPAEPSVFFTLGLPLPQKIEDEDEGNQELVVEEGAEVTAEPSNNEVIDEQDNQ